MPSQTTLTIYLGSGKEAQDLEYKLKELAKKRGESLSELVVKAIQLELVKA